MAMESRLLQASGVVASPRAGFSVSSSRAGTAHRQGQQGFRVAAQRFMRGVELREGASRRGRRVSRSGSVVVAARRPAVQGK